MFRRFLLILIAIIPLAAFCQSAVSKSDSLLNALNNAKEIEKADILIKLSEEFRLEPKGLAYAKQALDVANSLSNKKEQSEALFAIGRYYFDNYDEVQALSYYFKSLHISKEIEDKINVVKTSRNIGRAYFYLDSLEQSKVFAQKAIDLAVIISDGVQHAEALLDFADVLVKEFKQEEAIALIYDALELMQKHGKPLDLVNVYNSLGRQYFDIGEYHKSIENYSQGIAILESVNDVVRLAGAHHMLGRTHRTIGNFQLALEHYQKSLAFSEQLGDKRYIAANSNDIGIVYENLSRSQLATDDNEVNFLRALQFHEVALNIYKEIDDLPLMGNSLNNIANNYSRQATNKFVDQYGEAWEDSLFQLSSTIILGTFGRTFEYYNQALDIFKEIGDSKSIASVNINIGSHFIYTRNWQKAREHINQGLRLAEELNSLYEISLAYFHLGEISFRQGSFERAESQLQRSLSVSERLGIKDVTMHIHNKLSKVYEHSNDLAKSLKHIKIYNQIKDEIFSEESQKAITEMQTKYETEKKEQEILLLNNEKALQRSVIQRQRLMIILSVGGIIVILAFAGLLINMVRQKQRANRILEEKNELISHQKQEITDSIRYASRIQKAVLPSASILTDALKEHFVLFIPRDIVSGDFYWFTKLKDKMVLVAADCTGHGVPGAFMSMLGVSFLYEIVNKEGVTQPAEILNRLREFIKLTLSQTGKKDEQKDGMDISLSTLDLNNMKLEWAGAYNPLILIRDGELIEYKADKMPVAIHVTDHKPFTNNLIDIQQGDTFYMFSDGFPDQFGGTEGRKYMSKRFKQFLTDIHQFPMEEQKDMLFREYNEWRGEYDQIDDLVIFGVRV